MVIPFVLKGQAQAFDELASILHIPRENMTALLAEKKHPLPLPPTANGAGDFVFNSQYLQRLCHWVNSEKKTPSGKRANAPDFATVEHEIRHFLHQENQKNEWHVEEAIADYPPGHFLG